LQHVFTDAVADRIPDNAVTVTVADRIPDNAVTVTVSKQMAVARAKRRMTTTSSGAKSWWSLALSRVLPSTIPSTRRRKY
jgi:hypothetical protein